MTAGGGDPTSGLGLGEAPHRQLVRIRVYCHQPDHAGREPLASAVVGLLWREHAAGVTVLAGSEGFGAGRVVGRGATHHPAVVEWLDTEDAVDRVWPRLRSIVGDALVTRDTVTVLVSPPRGRPRLDPSRTVADVMGAGVVSVAPTERLDAVARLMYDRELRFLPVVEGGGLVGVITSGDLVRHGAAPLRLELHRALEAAPASAREGTAADVMTRRVVSTTPSTRLVDAARLMVDRGIKRLPVVDHGALVGVISRFDVLRSAAAAQVPAQPHELTGTERTAGDIARRDVPLLRPEASVSEVLDAVASTRLNRAVVVDSEERVVGVISDVALLQRVEAASEGLLARLMRRVHPHGAGDAAFGARTAADLMVAPAVTIARSASIEEAVRTIVERGRKVLPVVDEGGRFQGVIDRADALRALALHEAG
jgi:CBS domain-containing protein